MLVTAAQFKLARARRSLEKAHSERDWSELRRCDNELADCLNDAFDDKSRDAKSLINELEYILSTYAKIITELPDEAIQQSFKSGVIPKVNPSSTPGK